MKIKKIFYTAFKFIITIPITIYQIAVSPFLHHNQCRFIPTCSEYTKEAIKVHGFFKGCFLGFKRILKCNPFGNSGYDPVPKKIKSKKTN